MAGLCRGAYTDKQLKLFGARLELDAWRKRIQEQNLYVAVCNGKVVGYGSILNDYIVSLFVMPSFAMQGVGGKLMRRLEQVARRNKIKVVRVHSSINARDFYLKYGFTGNRKITHRFRFRPGSLPAISMRKKL